MRTKVKKQDAKDTEIVNINKQQLFIIIFTIYRRKTSKHQRGI